MSSFIVKIGYWYDQFKDMEKSYKDLQKQNKELQSLVTGKDTTANNYIELQQRFDRLVEVLDEERSEICSLRKERVDLIASKEHFKQESDAFARQLNRLIAKEKVVDSQYADARQKNIALRDEHIALKLRHKETARNLEISKIRNKTLEEECFETTRIAKDIETSNVGYCNEILVLNETIAERDGALQDWEAWRIDQESRAVPDDSKLTAAKAEIRVLRESIDNIHKVVEVLSVAQ